MTATTPRPEPRASTAPARSASPVAPVSSSRGSAPASQLGPSSPAPPIDPAAGSPAPRAGLPPYSPSSSPVAESVTPSPSGPLTPPPAAASSPGAADGLAELLWIGRRLGASDVHVVAERPVSMRVAGRLTPRGEPLSVSTVAGMLEAVVPPRHAAQLHERGYCDFAIDLEGAGRFRVNVARQRTGLKGCFRAVADTPPSLEQLGLPPELGKVTRYHQGLAIVSGPSGQGKTTTMAALVDLLNAGKPVHIITVEDPVEVVHPIKRAVVSQREVGTHTRSFASALRAALREDPDVIVIGELRDRETVEMALGAAETGHLVIATMSTASGAKTITRLIDMFPPDDQAQVRATLAGALKIVVSQRLVPRADGRALAAAAELITGNVPLWSLIRDDKLFQLPSLLQRGRAFGMIRIEESLAALVRAGVISEEVARQHADDPQGLAAALARPADAPAEPVPSSWRGGLRSFFDKGRS
ncbi:MAG: PilT/PilU family type 4a pilus ATPase [Myxococcales bacterium]|nr:PilT/PilU family type 4a pilus ATPase [Myxococcales bacterium]